VVDFIDMVLESNRDLVLRRLIECLSRDRTKHQVAEVTSLGLVQMTRKKLGLGLLESFSENCEVCAGRGIIVHHDPVIKHRQSPQPAPERRPRNGKSGNGNGGNGHNGSSAPADAAKAGTGTHGITEDAKHALALIAASTLHTPTGSIPVVRANGSAAAGNTGADKAGADKAGADKAGADKAGADKAGADKAGADKAGADKAGADKADAGNAGNAGNAGKAGNAGPTQRTAGTLDTAAADQDQAASSDGDQPIRRQGRRAQAERGQSRRDPSRRDASQRGAAQRDSATDAASAATENVVATAPQASAVAAPLASEPTVDGEAAEAESVAILDIPVRRSTQGKRPVSKQVTEQLLDSVLEALPEPKQPGQGRSRSRRVTTAGGSTQSAPTIVTPSNEPHS
jgi:ribonuclease E